MRVNRRRLWVVAGLLAIAATAVPGMAQNEVKEKSPIYVYVSQWDIPRAQWSAMDKADADDLGTYQKGMADGAIIAFGNDINLVHQPDQPTHDEWWVANSMAGLLNLLDQFYKSGSPSTPVLESATKHWDGIYVSRYYNWKPGTYKGVYSQTSTYKLKPTADSDAVDSLSKNLFGMVMEKMLAQGAIVEYDIDTEAIHTDPAGTIFVNYIAANADGLDKVRQAVTQSTKTNPMIGPAINDMVDYQAHRDYLSRTNATLK